MSYGLLAVFGAKILAVDFHRAQAAALAVSLLCYRAVLIAIPRITKS